MEKALMISFRSLLVLLIMITAVSGCRQETPVVDIQVDRSEPPIAFGVSELEKSLKDQGLMISDDSESTFDIQLELLSELESEAYQIKSSENRISITAGGSNGAMYALISLSDHIRLKGIGEPISENEKPHVKKRGIKFNVPLDIRTPSYDDTGDAAQNNIETMWELEFWENFLDNMARYRYNLLTLWSTHPYPSWVKLEKYSDVALEDVYRFGGEMDHLTHMKWKGENIYDLLELVKKMTIEEKISFWKKVFQYAEDRGIEIYLFHWNVFVHGAEGKHGITWEQDNPITVDYIRESVKSMLLTYPNIKGIGVTAGEHIDRQLTGKYKTENWMWLTYGKAIMEAKEVNPDLDVRFIFRRHWSDLNDIRTAFKDFDGEIETSFKYSRARMYSSDNPPWFDKIYREDVEAQNVQCWLNIRNDDFFTFRWGDPEYAKVYIHNLPMDVSPGFYMGPDGYVWGREFISKKPTNPRQFEIDKHWYRFMIWGRTAYNPNLPADFYRDQLAIRFPGVAANSLYETWKLTSSVISLVDKLHFRQNDAQFAPEGSFDKEEFHSINSIISIPPMPEQGVASIPEFLSGEMDLDMMTPEMVGDSLVLIGDQLLANATSITAGKNQELAETLGDFKAWGNLSKYYGNKIQSGLYLARFRKNGEASDQEKSLELMNEALRNWEAYAKAATIQYKPQLYARTQLLDWDAITDSVRMDLRIIRDSKMGDPVELQGNNYLWDRDKRRF